MKLKKWKILKSKYVLKNRWIKIKQETCQLPGGDVIDDYFVKETRGWASIFAITPDNKVIFNRQYKHGCQEVVLELPAGGIDKNESPKESIKRELYEETGHEVKKVKYIGSYFISPTSNRGGKAHLFLGFGAKKIGKPKNDPKEVIQVQLIEINKILEKIRKGEINVLPQIGLIYRILDELGMLEIKNQNRKK